MMFFGGFGSIVPYVIYLSLIWAFLIFGLRGKIGTVLHIALPKSHSVEHTIRIDNVHETASYSQEKIKKENKTTFHATFGLSFLFNCLDQITLIKSEYCTSKSNLISRFYSELSRRGPPFN